MIIEIQNCYQLFVEEEVFEGNNKLVKINFKGSLF